MYLTIYTGIVGMDSEFAGMYEDIDARSSPCRSLI